MVFSCAPARRAVVLFWLVAVVRDVTFSPSKQLLIDAAIG